jgi:hypothetical protein
MALGGVPLAEVNEAGFRRRRFSGVRLPAFGACGKHQQINARERYHTLSSSVRSRSDGLVAEGSSNRLRARRSVGCRSRR